MSSASLPQDVRRPAGFRQDNRNWAAPIVVTLPDGGVFAAMATLIVLTLTLAGCYSETALSVPTPMGI